MKYFISRLVLHLVSVLLVIFVMFSQNSIAQILEEPVAKKNMLEINFSLREFFDGSPIVQKPYPRTLRWMNLGLGIAYDRKFGSKHGFLLSATLNGNSYWYSPYPEKPGDIFFRVGFYLEGCYQHLAFRSKKSSLYGVLGPNLRLGHEAVMIYRSSNEVTSSVIPLRDWGIAIGLRGSTKIIERLSFNGELKFVQYLYRYARHQSPQIPYPNRPTSNMLVMQIGLGYKF